MFIPAISIVVENKIFKIVLSKLKGVNINVLVKLPKIENDENIITCLI